MSRKADRSGTVQPKEEEAYGGILSFYFMYCIKYLLLERKV